MDAYKAVLNSHRNNALDQSIALFMVYYGNDTFRSEIYPYLEKGLTSIFEDAPSKYTEFFVESIHKFVNE